MADESVLNTIDRALDDCKQKIRSNKTNANVVLFLTVMVVLGFGGGLIEIKTSAENKSKNISMSLDRLTTSNSQLSEDINNAEVALYRISEMSYSKDDGGKNIILASRDSLKSLRAQFKRTLIGYDSIRNELEAFSKSLNNTSELIFYGISILVFGVLTSFYRYFLKEISKYEHYLFGMHRIRIAANNYEGGFADEVRTALTFNAFSNTTDNVGGLFKNKSKVQSPIPGHPTSDATTFLLNKIVDSLEIVIKPKGAGDK